eukprot:767412-Hanusia_phi.AAC.1
MTVTAGMPSQRAMAMGRGGTQGGREGGRRRSGRWGKKIIGRDDGGSIILHPSRTRMFDSLMQVWEEEYGRKRLLGEAVEAGRKPDPRSHLASRRRACFPSS